MEATLPPSGLIGYIKFCMLNFIAAVLLLANELSYCFFKAFLDG
jgi:hypothetical protein